MADMVCLECRTEKYMSSAGHLCMYGMLECKLWCETLLLHMADMDFFNAEGCGVSSAEYCIHLVSVHRGLGACRKFCGVCSWENRTRCWGGVKMLWCDSPPIFLDPSLHTLVFCSVNCSVTCSCCFFLHCFSDW